MVQGGSLLRQEARTALRRPKVWAAAFAVIGCAALLLLAGSADHGKEEDEYADALASLSETQAKLATVRGQMLALQHSAQSKHVLASQQAELAAKDRHLEQRLKHFSEMRVKDAKQAEAKAKAGQLIVKKASAALENLKKHIALATKHIHDLTKKGDDLLASKPRLNKEIQDVKKRLDELTSEHKYLHTKAALLAAGAKPHLKKYQSELDQVHSKVLQANKLKAQAKLYEAQAKVIADNLKAELAQLSADQKKTDELKQESETLPPTNAKLKMPKFRSLAAKAKGIFTLAGSEITKVQTDDKKALAEKKSLLRLQKKLDATEAKVASVDTVTAKLDAKAARSHYIGGHLKADADRAALKDSKIHKEQLALAAKAKKLIEQVDNVDPEVARAKRQLHREGALLKAYSVDLGHRKQVAMKAAHEVLADEVVVAHEDGAATKDLKLASGATKAAKLHEAQAQRLSAAGNELDSRVDALSTALEESDRRIARAQELAVESASAQKELAASLSDSDTQQ